MRQPHEREGATATEQERVRRGTTAGETRKETRQGEREKSTAKKRDGTRWTSEQETDDGTEWRYTGREKSAVVCRGPPHWHTVIRYDPHRTPTRTSDLTVISEVTIRQVLVQCRLARRSPLISWQIGRQRDKALTRSHPIAICIFFIEKQGSRPREGGRVPTDRIVVGRARGREKHHRQFYSPSYYLSLLHRNDLTIIAPFP